MLVKHEFYVFLAQPPSPVTPPVSSPAPAAATVPVIPKLPVPEASSKDKSGKATGMGTYEELHRSCKGDWSFSAVFKRHPVILNEKHIAKTLVNIFIKTFRFYTKSIIT